MTVKRCAACGLVFETDACPRNIVHGQFPHGEMFLRIVVNYLRRHMGSHYDIAVHRAAIISGKKRLKSKLAEIGLSRDSCVMTIPTIEDILEGKCVGDYENFESDRAGMVRAAIIDQKRERRIRQGVAR